MYNRTVQHSEYNICKQLAIKIVSGMGVPGILLSIMHQPISPLISPLNRVHRWLTRGRLKILEIIHSLVRLILSGHGCDEPAASGPLVVERAIDASISLHSAQMRRT